MRAFILAILALPLILGVRCGGQYSDKDTTLHQLVFPDCSLIMPLLEFPAGTVVQYGPLMKSGDCLEVPDVFKDWVGMMCLDNFKREVSKETVDYVDCVNVYMPEDM